MKKRSILFLALVAGALIIGLTAATEAMSGTVQADQRAMAAANELVAAGHLDQAGVIYQQLLDQGVADAAVFYNLGNVAMLQNDPSRALVLYQQAAELSPRDSDIRHNLALAQEQAGQADGSRSSGVLAVGCAGQPLAVDSQRTGAAGAGRMVSAGLPGAGLSSLPARPAAAGAARRRDNRAGRSGVERRDAGESRSGVSGCVISRLCDWW